MRLSRRDVLAASAGAISMAASSSVFAASNSKRKFTVDLRWGSIGVKANQRQAIELAAKHGFESVAASPNDLAKLSDQQNEDLVAELKSKGLVWGSSGLPSSA